MIQYIKGQSAQELNYNWTLADLKEFASELKIKGRSSMNKIKLSMAIEEEVN
jgi:hypothetical protein